METEDNLGYYLTAVFAWVLASYGAAYLIGNSIERWASKRFLPSVTEK